MKKPTTICITGARTTYNHGTTSIIASGVELFNKILQNDVECIIMSPNCDIDDANYRKVIQQCNFKTVGVRYSRLPYPVRLILLTLVSIPQYLKSDLIIDMRGEGYVNSSVAITQSVQLLLAKLLRKPFCIYAQSLGPFNSKINKFFAKLTLERAEFITIREPISLDYFEDLNTSKKGILCADQAILLNPVSLHVAKEILTKYGISSDRKIIGISPIPNDKSIHLLATISDYLIEKYNVHIILIPHANDENMGGCQGNDDFRAANDVYAQIKRKNAATVINFDHTAKEIKGLMGCCEIYISFRWHAAIASLSTCNPTIVVNSAHKSAAMSMIGVDNYIIDSKTVDYSILQERVDDCWENRKEIRDYLNKKMSEMRSLALISSELSANVLKNRS